MFVSSLKSSSGGGAATRPLWPLRRMAQAPARRALHKALSGWPSSRLPDRPIKGPDGMRAANGKLYLAENRNGRASMVTVNGDQATVVTILDGLTQPTAIEPAGDTLWVGDRAGDKAIALAMPK
jgi:hypothetical protein